jgi:hypothetical protein
MGISINKNGERMKKFFYGVLSLVLLAGIVFGVGVASLGWDKFFSPKRENIRREVFENTKSYTHGKIQDLAKYYEEYQKGSDQDKQIVSNLVKMNFSDFDADKIDNYQLRAFLTSVRGF